MNFVGTAWDMFLAETTISQVKFFLYLMKIQKMNITQIDDDKIMVSLKNMDKTPLPVMEFEGVPRKDTLQFVDSITKKDVLGL